MYSKNRRHKADDVPVMGNGGLLGLAEVGAGLSGGALFNSLARNNAKPGKPLPPAAYGDPEPHRSALAKYVKLEDRPVFWRSWSHPFPHMRGDW